MSDGVGAVISTISWMMWRGVRNWPFCPALAILDSMYSYTSPLVSRSSIGIASSPSTAFSSSAGVGMVSRAPFMCLAWVLFAARDCMNGNTYLSTTSYMSWALRFLNRSQRRSSYGRPTVASSGVNSPSGKIGSSIGSPVRFALRSASVWRSSRPLMNSR